MTGCGRPGCGAPASATMGYDGARRAAWLHPLDEPEATGRLCQRHADSFRVPRGWRFFDYRETDAAPEAAERSERQRGAQPKPALVAASGIDLDDLLDAQSPLLERAFQGARAS
jgi:Protein of unknown function (DUF3499)